MFGAHTPSSTKGATGHTLGAAGGVEAVIALLAPRADAQSLAALDIAITTHAASSETGSAVAGTRACADVALEALRSAIPAARGLPLLVALAVKPALAPVRADLDYLTGLCLQVAIDGPFADLASR